MSFYRKYTIPREQREPGGVPEAACAHCGLPVDAGRRFCCSGCAAAFETIQRLGLGSYYEQCVAGAPSRPGPPEPRDLTRFIATRADGMKELSLAVDGLRCGACVWLIESVLNRDPALRTGRINMTTRRLRLVWDGPDAATAGFAAAVEALGYRLVPFDPAALAKARDDTGQALVRALAVAGFAAINIMLMSIGVWAGEAAGLLGDMGPATRDLLHYVSAVIALPTVAYAGMPFFRTAFAALRRGRANMDVPVSLGVVLVSGLSFWQTLTHGAHTYFDSAVALLFFLLIGRLLDHRARGHVRRTAELLLTLQTADVTVIRPDGGTARGPAGALVPGDRILVGMGERLGADGTVESGDSSIDVSLVTGESLPATAVPGMKVFAGTVNLGMPMTILVTGAGGATLLAAYAQLIEAAEGRRSRFVVLADRVARAYAPLVHLTALAAFLGWYVWGGASLPDALLIACAVLIITCPCAIALAVPCVQVIATSRLFQAGILLKSGTALERLAEVDTVVFDKTGTLTQPSLALIADRTDPAALRVAASLAAHSGHPLARALTAACRAAYGPVPLAEGVKEYPGQGLGAGATRLGSAAFTGAIEQDEPGPVLWLRRPGLPLVRFGFEERLRFDATATVTRLRDLGLKVRLLSGDKTGAVASIAAAAGIGDWRGECSPVEKVSILKQIHGSVLMVGDGLNDGPCLAEADVSASPASAADISQTIADAVFQGDGLGAIVRLVVAARWAKRLMRLNIALSVGYNMLMVPLAVGGFVTPWLAAAAMSASSLLVAGNSFRRGK